MRSFLAFLLLVPGLVLAARPAFEKPNVIVILLDDAGYGDFAHAGNPVIATPNLTKMVREGANFPQFYSAAAACTASRYGILTGRNHLRSGLPSWAIGPETKRHLHVKELTLAEGLKEQGYATAIFGKWHLGTPNAANEMTAEAFPLAHGFDRWLGTNVSNDYETGSNLIQGPAEKGNPIPGYEIVEEDIDTKVSVQESLTKRYADAAVSFIREKKEQPFFIYMTPNMPHLPVHASEEFKGKSPRGRYGDCISEIDHQLGRIRSTLEESGIAKNTLIIFTSDNGPWILYQDTARHPVYDEARLLVGSALPFRDGKGSTWEGGQRVAGVWCWPGTIPEETVVREPASALDVFPTVMMLAGGKVPEDRTMDGRDVRGLLGVTGLQGMVKDFRFIYADSKEVNAARFGPWKIHTKIISQLKTGHGFEASKEKPLLFQVEEDFPERIDRAAGRVDELKEGLRVIREFEDSLVKEGSFWDGR
ncbi:sulfatase-like hydrolase/transferase [Luteolibacter sp. GHJ8]|uniref:Sulfatase-like hydrolase/transferase n=1 Tax=Luteolibacter rhizosphaerae TaxID=2989719 RepID=A0ABT3G628_9BACT|nr:sulfatase-like hydrolase/transferase [Luteolibacter rhizosphaerae]MCW1915039.1 sulfatase-like hydrolase/transferase [Luteolibacter rhizosphaerae]